MAANQPSKFNPKKHFEQEEAEDHSESFHTGENKRETGGGGGGGKASPSKMPFFKKKKEEEARSKDAWEVEVMMHKQSEEAKKRLEHCQFLAQASPEPSYDISKCELTQIPAGTCSQCKVFRKEVFIISDNLLSSFNGGGNFKDLSLLRVLDLRNNRFTHFPDALVELTQLQVLDAQDNKLKQLPKNMGKMQALQTLNVRSNLLKDLPDSLCQMPSLRTLDISNNQVRSLPWKFCNIRTLESVSLDADHMTHPPPDVCQAGTESIMKYMCAENHVEYSPPSKHLLPVLNPYTSSSQSSHALEALQREEDQLNTSVLNYETRMNQKQHDFVRMEQELAQLEAQQAQLAEVANRDRALRLQTLARDHEELDNDIRNVQAKSSHERMQMVQSLQEVEARSSDLVKQLLDMNEKAKKKEILIDEMERKMMEDEELFRVQAEERALVREKEVVVSMESILRERLSLESQRLKYEARRDSATREALKMDFVDMEKLGSHLQRVQHEREEMFEELIKEEEFQRHAFETLLINKDMQHKRLTDTIYMIQQQLAELTLAEIEKQKMRASAASISLEQKRVDLASLLKQLLIQRDEREAALKQRMIEMEERREQTETDYWLVQYQRLLDRKPQSLIDQENNLEFAVVDILQEAGAEDYIPKFARHRVSIETMMQMDLNDLREIGIHEVGLRRAVLAAIKGYSQVQERAMEKAAALERTPEPTAPPLEDDTRGAKGKKMQEEEAAGAGGGRPLEAVRATEGFSPAEDVTVRVNTECVICMERDSDMLFLNCGHVCCCTECSQPLLSCPLCRGDIISKIIIGKSLVG